MSASDDLVQAVARALIASQLRSIFKIEPTADMIAHYQSDFIPDADAAIAAVRAHDREQRARIDELLAPKTDPDDYRDLHLVTRMDRAPGIGPR